MRRSHCHFAAVAAAWIFAGVAVAQPAPDAQQRYQNDLAVCNSGSLAAPAREACVRTAGQALDRRLGGPPPEVEVASPGGRAVIISPAGAPVPSSDTGTTTSNDGRATIVPPADAPAATPR